MEAQELFEIIYKSVCTGYDFGKFESAHGVTGTDLDKVARDILSKYVEIAKVQPIGFMDNPSLAKAIEEKKSLETHEDVIEEEKELPVELEEHDEETVVEPTASIEPETIDDDYEPEFNTSVIEKSVQQPELEEVKGTTNGKKLTKEEIYKQLESLMREFKDAQEEETAPIDDYDKAISDMLNIGKGKESVQENPIEKVEEPKPVKKVVDNNAMHVGTKTKAITPETPALTPFGTVAEKTPQEEPSQIVYISEKINVEPQEEKKDYTQFFNRDVQPVEEPEPVKPKYNDTPFNYNGVVKNIIKSIKNDKNIIQYAKEYEVMPTDCLFLSTKQSAGKHVALILRLINKATGEQSYKYAIYNFQINPDGKGKVFNVTDKFEYKLPSLDGVKETALNWNEQRQHLFENNMSEITNAYLKDAFVPEVRNEYMNWLRACMGERPESMVKIYQYFIREF